MEQYATPPEWLEVLGWISLSIAFASALFFFFEFYILGRRQKMWIMEAVYPITALYIGPLAIWFYLKYGRKKSKMKMDMGIHSSQVTKGTFHCGAGCTLGDIIAGWIIFGLSITIARKALYADFVLDFVFAWLLGIIFQYFTIVPMRNLRIGEGLWQAIKADTFSIIAFQIGLFFGMYVYQEWFFGAPLPKTTSSYWFLMQLSMILGFFTAYPVVKWLYKIGVKEAM